LKILFAGCGDIGCRAASRLVADFTCAGFKRNPQTLPDFIQPLAGSMADRDRLVDVLSRGFDIVVASLTPDAFSEEGYRRAYVDSAKTLAEAMTLSESVPKLVIWVSSTSVYGDNNGEWVDEQSVTEPQSFSGKLILEAEQHIANLPCASTIVRFSGIYGPGRTRMLDQIRAGKGRPAEPKQWSNRIYSEDCGAVLEHLVRRFVDGVELDGLYIASDSEPVTQHQLRKWLAAQLGVTLQEEHSEQKAIRRCSNQRLLDTGYRFLYPSYRDGYRALIDQQ